MQPFLGYATLLHKRGEERCVTSKKRLRARLAPSAIQKQKQKKQTKQTNKEKKKQTNFHARLGSPRKDI